MTSSIHFIKKNSHIQQHHTSSKTNLVKGNIYGNCPAYKVLSSPLSWLIFIHKIYKIMTLYYILICIFIHYISLSPSPKNINSLKVEDYYFVHY